MYRCRYYESVGIIYGFHDFPTCTTVTAYCLSAISPFIALLISVSVEVRFIRYASFNLHIGLFEVDTFFSIRTTPNNMEIGKLGV